jgi:hypothetical protein
LSVVEANFNQSRRAVNAIVTHWKKEKALTFILEENALNNRAKPWLSDRQIYVGSGTMLTPGCNLDDPHDYRSHCRRPLGSIQVGARNIKLLLYLGSECYPPEVAENLAGKLTLPCC